MQKVEPRYWEGVRPFFWIEMSEMFGSPCMAVYFDQGDLWYLILGASQAGDLTWMNGAEAISLFIREAEGSDEP